MSEMHLIQTKKATASATRKRRSLAVLFGAMATIAVGTAAQGAVVATVTNLGTLSNTSGSYPGFTAYKITLSTTDGSVISGVDFGGSTSDPTAITRGFFSTSFLQRTTLGTDADGNATVTSTPQSTVLNGSASVNSLDSHFLQPAAARIDAPAPAETFNSANLAGGPVDTTSSDYGRGTSLTATYGIAAPSQTASFDFAYIVLPNTATATFSGTAAVNGQVASILNGTIGPNAAIPEPTSLAAIALGGVSLLRRKRTA